MCVCMLYSPVVSRFFWPPEMPLSISSPTNVSAHESKPNIFVRNILVPLNSYKDLKKVNYYTY